MIMIVIDIDNMIMMKIMKWLCDNDDNEIMIKY